MNKDHEFLRVEEKACSVSKSIKAPKWKNLLFFLKAEPGNNGGFVSQTLPWLASWWEKGRRVLGRRWGRWRCPSVALPCCALQTPL